MSSSAPGPSRAIRAALVAALVLALTAVAHRVGGGSLPDPLIVAALAAFTFAGTTAAARTRFTAPRLVVVLGGSQLALHAALTWLGGHGPHGVTGVARCVPASTTGHAAHGPASACVTSSGATSVPDAAGSLSAYAHHAGGGWEMPAAHVVATVVLALVIARGERAFERLVAWLSSRLVRLAVVVTLPTARSATPVAVPVRALAHRHAAAAPTRGPPLRGRPVGTSA